MGLNSPSFFYYFMFLQPVYQTKKVSITALNPARIPAKARPQAAPFSNASKVSSSNSGKMAMNAPAKNVIKELNKYRCHGLRFNKISLGIYIWLKALRKFDARAAGAVLHPALSVST